MGSLDNWPFPIGWFEIPYRSPWADNFSEWIGKTMRLNLGSELSLRQMPRQKPVRIRSLAHGAGDEPWPHLSGMIR